MIIKAAKRIFNSGKICRSYSDLNFGVTFLEHSVYSEIRKRSGGNDFGSFCADQNIHLNQENDRAEFYIFGLNLLSIEKFVALWPSL